MSVSFVSILKEARYAEKMAKEATSLEELREKLSEHCILWERRIGFATVLKQIYNGMKRAGYNFDEKKAGYNFDEKLYQEYAQFLPECKEAIADLDNRLYEDFSFQFDVVKELKEGIEKGKKGGNVEAK